MNRKFERIAFFDQFNATLLNKIINYKKNILFPKLRMIV